MEKLLYNPCTQCRCLVQEMKLVAKTIFDEYGTKTFSVAETKTSKVHA